MLSRASARKVRPDRTEPIHIPAPIGGLNTVDPGFDLPELDCPLLYNMIGAENGLRVRLGYKEWCTGLVGAADNTVRSVLPFQGSGANGAKDRLFACMSSQIYSVGASSAAPPSVLAFASAVGNAGWGQARGVVNAANGHFLMYCDEENGYHVYTETSDTWAKIVAGVGATDINGVDPAKFVFTAVWKNFVLFVEKDTSKMWFGGAVRSLFGTVTAWDFGAQFPHGGNLVGLWSWTIDGGIGIDDYLVAISSSGDVVIYKGTDPNSAATFAIVGVWFIGGVPAGRRIAADFGGDLLILSSIGVIPLSKLVTGTDQTDTSQYATQKIGNLFNKLVSSTGTVKGWSLRLHPEDASLLVMVPVADGQPTQQLAMSLRTRGWSRYRDLPILSAEGWGGKFYFGTADGRVCVGTGNLDNVNLAATQFSLIKFSGITGFQNGENARQKQISEIRATYLYEGGLLATAEQARFRYDLTEVTPPSPVPSNNSNVFDTALFDTAVFGGDFATQQIARGAAGMGPDMAVAFAGSAGSRTVLAGIDVSYTEGGML